MSAEVLSLQVEGLAATAPHWSCVRGQTEGPVPWALAWPLPLGSPHSCHRKESIKQKDFLGDQGDGMGSDYSAGYRLWVLIGSQRVGRHLRA